MNKVVLILLMVLISCNNKEKFKQCPDGSECIVVCGSELEINKCQEPDCIIYNGQKVDYQEYYESLRIGGCEDK